MKPAYFVNQFRLPIHKKEKGGILLGDRKVVMTMKALESMIVEGRLQHELFDTVKDHGLTAVEIRRELFQDVDEEIQKINQVNKGYNFDIYYSIPAYIFKDGTVDAEAVENYFKEAASLHALYLKLSIGDFNPSESTFPSMLDGLSNKYGIRLTIENDQTRFSGTIEAAKTYFERCGELGYAAKATFDVGNWIFVGQDPVEASVEIGRYVDYVHLKDISPSGRGLLTVEPDDGVVKWRVVMGNMPKGVPVGLEYPLGSDRQRTLRLIDELKAL